MKRTGTIVSIEKGIAAIKLDTHTCSTCGCCSADKSGLNTVVLVKNTDNSINKGTTVEFDLPSKTVYRHIFLSYGLPTLLLVTWALLSIALPPAVCIAGALCSVILLYILLPRRRILDCTLRKHDDL